MLDELHIFSCSPNRLIKSRRMILVGHAVYMRKISAYKISVRNHLGDLGVDGNVSNIE